METRLYTSLRLQPADWTAGSPPILGYDNRRPYPTWDAFGGWEVERFTDKRMGYEDPWSICVTGMPEYNFDTPIREQLAAAPVVEPFYPGWPTLVGDGE